MVFFIPRHKGSQDPIKTIAVWLYIDDNIISQWLGFSNPYLLPVIRLDFYGFFLILLGVFLFSFFFGFLLFEEFILPDVHRFLVVGSFFFLIRLSPFLILPFRVYLSSIFSFLGYGPCLLIYFRFLLSEFFLNFLNLLFQIIP